MRKLFTHLRNQWMGALALFIVLAGGTAWAASELSKNEVRSKHIKNGQVKKKDLKNNAVTTKKVKNASLLGEDFAPGQLPRGERGPSGATNVLIRIGEEVTCNTEGCEVPSEARCEAGERAVGGGGEASIQDDITHSRPIGDAAGVPVAWSTTVSDEAGDSDASASSRAWVVCASP